MFTAVSVAASRRVKTALTRTHHDEWIDHAGRTLRTVNPYRLSQEPRSSICRKQITDNPSRIFYVGCTDARISPIYSSARLCRARSHWSWQGPRHDSQNIGGKWKILIIKTDVTVPVITIFYIAPNEIEWIGGINFVAVAINGECDLFARTLAPVCLPVFYYNFQPRLIQYHRSY